MKKEGNIADIGLPEEGVPAWPPALAPTKPRQYRNRAVIDYFLKEIIIYL